MNAAWKTFRQVRLKISTVYGVNEKILSFSIYSTVTRVDPLTSILAVLARSCQIRTTSWQPWIPWQDSY